MNTHTETAGFDHSEDSLFLTEFGYERLSGSKTLAATTMNSFYSSVSTTTFLVRGEGEPFAEALGAGNAGHGLVSHLSRLLQGLHVKLRSMSWFRSNLYCLVTYYCMNLNLSSKIFNKSRISICIYFFRGIHQIEFK